MTARDLKTTRMTLMRENLDNSPNTSLILPPQRTLGEEYRYYQNGWERRKEYQSQRVINVDAVEMEVPIVVANMLRSRPPTPIREEQRLPPMERGTTLGVPFDLCSLSTVGGLSATSTHRRFKKYTTTTITTTTVTNIMLPHMGYMALADGNTATHAQKLLMPIEGHDGRGAPHLKNGNTVESSHIGNGHGDIFSRNSELEQSEWSDHTIPALHETLLKATRHQKQGLSSASGNGSQQISATLNNHNDLLLPGDSAPHTEISLPQLQPRQTSVISRQTTSKASSVLHNQPPLPPSIGDKKQDLPLNGTVVPMPDQQARHSKTKVTAEPQKAITPLHLQYPHIRSMPGVNGRADEDMRQPWIINEEGTQREWHLAR